jgi:quercetin dioxygenase-like cupin family protein
MSDMMSETSAYATSDEMHIATDDLPWAPFPGVEDSGFKLLRVNRDISGMTALLRIPKGVRGPMHKHCGAGEYLILQGHIDFGDRKLGPGDYFFEPAGLRHSEPPPDEDVVMLVVSYGPIATTRPDGSPGPVVDAELMAKLWERALHEHGH